MTLYTEYTIEEVDRGVDKQARAIGKKIVFQEYICETAVRRGR